MQSCGVWHSLNVIVSFYRAMLCLHGIFRHHVSVHLSQNGSTGRASLRYKKISVSPKIRVLPSGTLSETLNFKISPQQVDRVVSITRRRSYLLTTL